MKSFLSIIFLALLIFILTNCREDIVEITPEVKTGDLYIKSIPSGAEIIFNDTKTGKITPDSLLGIQPGNYNLTVRILGVGQSTEYVDIISGKKKFIIIHIGVE